jgi:outer membrane biosynthesis protein TonB
MNPRARAGRLLAFCTSVGVHGVAYASLASSGHAPLPRDFVSEVSIEVKPPPAPAAPPEPLPPPPIPAPTAIKSTTSKIAPTPTVATVTPAPSAPSPAPTAPLDLSGVTLTNDTGAGFAMPVGDGSALHAPIGSSRRAAEPVHTPAVTTATAGPALVAASDLSVHPVPPALGGLLRANYPEAARQRGLAGTASVRARIDADGVVRLGRVVAETSTGFGAACRRTVVGSRWSAPRDKDGRPVATEIVYTCRFEVDQ